MVLIGSSTTNDKSSNRFPISATPLFSWFDSWIFFVLLLVIDRSGIWKWSVVGIISKCICWSIKVGGKKEKVWGKRVKRKTRVEWKNKEKSKKEKRDEIEEKTKRESYLATVGEMRRFSQKSMFVLMYNGEFLVSNYNNLALPSVFSISFTGIWRHVSR